MKLLILASSCLIFYPLFIGIATYLFTDSLIKELTHELR
jgi:hypothetical protein